MTTLLCILNILFSSLHPVHVGLTTIEMEENNNAQILFKFDIESFKYVFLHNYLTNIKFDEEVFSEKEIKFINDYIDKNFLLNFDSRRAKLEYSSHDIKGDEITLYFQTKILSPPDSILVRNLLLLDVNLNQTNVVIIKSGTFEKGFLLNRDDYTFEMNLSEIKL